MQPSMFTTASKRRMEPCPPSIGPGIACYIANRWLLHEACTSRATQRRPRCSSAVWPSWPSLLGIGIESPGSGTSILSIRSIKAINSSANHAWKQLYGNPGLSRILEMGFAPRLDKACALSDIRT
jgi:hypothetical protein